MRKLLFFLLLFILTISGAEEEVNPNINFGVENPQNLGITNPKVVSYLDLEFNERGIFEIVPSQTYLNELNLELHSFPQDDYYISVSNLQTNPSASLEDGYYLFTWRSLPAGEEGYTLSSSINSEFDIKKLTSSQPFPFSDIPHRYRKYLEPTTKIDSDNLAIKQKANEIVLGETDGYVAAYKLAKYVSNEVSYDLDYLGRIEQASTVLEDKTGVCVEYSNLFIALSRSVGIPARYISGYAYGNVYGEKFNAHAWTEIYLPKVGWVPFDPTFREFGWIDPTHIKTQISEGPEAPSLRFSWIGGDVSTDEPSTSVDLNRKEENLPKFVTNRIWVEKEEVGFGSYNIIWMSLENKEDFYLVPDAFLTAAPKIVGKNQKSVLLPPHNSLKVGWIIQTPEDLDTGFAYTYTIRGATLFGDEKSVSFKVSPQSNDVISLEEARQILGVQEDVPTQGRFAPNLKVNLKVPAVAYLNENFSIEVELSNSGNAPISDLSICLEDASKDCEQIYLGINDNQTVLFSKEAYFVGTEKLFLTLSGDGIEESQVIKVDVRKRNIGEWISKIISDLFGLFNK